MVKKVIKYGVMMIAVGILASLSFAGAGAAADIWDGSTIATAFHGGTGAENDPYQIATGAELAYLAQEVNKGNNTHHYYILTDDIDLASHPWTPIGNISYTFSGSINGNDKTISNLKITATQGYAGLIGRIYNDDNPLHFSNLTLKNVDISGTALVGSLIGSIDYASDVKIENCTVTGSIKITGTDVQIGGLIGAAQSPESSFTSFEIDNCTVSGDEGSYVRGFEQVGGIVGGSAHSSSLDLKKCVSNIEVIGYAKLGGLIGQALRNATGIPDHPVTITDSSSYGNLHILNGIDDGKYTDVEDVKGFGTIVGCIAEEEILPAQLAISNSKSSGSIIGWGNLSSTWTHDGSKPGLIGYYRATSDQNRTACRDQIYSSNCVYYASAKDYAHLVREGGQDKLYNGGKVITDPVARIGNTKYNSLEDAIAAAKSGETITLLADIDLTAYEVGTYHCLNFADGVTLDLAGYTISSNNAGIVYQGKNAKIQNGTFVSVDGGSYALHIGDELGLTENFEVDDLTCTGGINICNASVVINSTTGTTISGTAYYAVWCDENAQATINGGTYTSASTDGGSVINCEYPDDNTWIHITGGKYAATTPIKIFGDSTEEKITVSGGYFSDDSVADHLAPGYRVYANTDGATKTTWPYLVDICEARADDFFYNAAPSTPKLNTTAQATDVSFYYSTSAVAEDGIQFPTAATTGLNAGTYYVYATFKIDGQDKVSKRSTFKVTQAKYATPETPTVDVSGEDVTVTINGYDPEKAYVYSINDDQHWVVAPSESFTISGLKASTSYNLYLMVAESRNYMASDAVSVSFVTPGYFTVNYNANGGVGEIAAQTAQQGQSVSAKSSDGFIREGYSFTNWKNSEGATVAVGSSVDDGTTLYAQWTPNTYTVRFDANGGSGSMSDQEFTYDAPSVSLTKNSFTRSGYTFAGWSTSAAGPSLYIDEQKVQNLAGSGSVTLYAKWVKNTSLITVAGSIKGNEGTVTVELKRGNETIYSCSPTESSYDFPNIPAGTYNLVATDARPDGTTVTVTYIVSSDEQTIDITFPPSSVNSVLSVSSKQNTPPVIVGGLNDEALAKSEENKNVTVVMVVEAVVEQQLNESATAEEKQVQVGITEIKSVAESMDLDNVQYLNISVAKVTEDATGSTTDSLKETSNVLHLIIPFDTTGKENIWVFSYHDGTVVSYTEAKIETDGTFYVDDGNIHVFTQKFSEYGIGYSQSQPEPEPKPKYSSSSSGNGGATIILTETPAPVPTQASTSAPTVKPTASAQQTQKSPAPFVGLVAGLGAAVFILRMRQ